MSELDLQNVQWLWDEVPHYRLTDQIVHEFLSEHWEGYQFYIEVKLSWPRGKAGVQLTLRSSKATNLNSGSHENSQRYCSCMDPGKPWRKYLACNAQSDCGLGREG